MLNIQAATNTIAQLTPTRRVVALDELQWAVQDLIGERWRNIAYCRWRNTILERFVPSDANLQAVESLRRLPAMCGGSLDIDRPPSHARSYFPGGTTLRASEEHTPSGRTVRHCKATTTR